MTLTRKDLRVGDAVRITGDDNERELNGRVAMQLPEKTIVFVGSQSWFEFTDLSDIEVRSRQHVHVH